MSATRAWLPPLIAATALLAFAAAGASADEVRPILPRIPAANPSFGGVPKRIVSLTPSVTETLFAVGAGPRVIAVSNYCDYPPEVSSLPRVGTFLVPVVEAVIQLAPDLVITSPSPGNRNAVEAMERAGIRVVVVSEGSGSIDDVLASIDKTSSVVGYGFEGKALLSSIDGTLEAIRKAAAGGSKPAVAVVVGHEPLVLAGPQSYLGEIVVLSGGRNIADPLGGKWPRTGLEFLIAAEPAIIIDASTGGDGTSEAEILARRWSRFDALPAVASGRVHGHASHLLLRPGPRLGDAARVVAGWISPYKWDGRP